MNAEHHSRNKNRIRSSRARKDTWVCGKKRDQDMACMVLSNLIFSATYFSRAKMLVGVWEPVRPLGVYSSVKSLQRRRLESRSRNDTE
jgi:hypothetical protein